MTDSFTKKFQKIGILLLGKEKFITIKDLSYIFNRAQKRTSQQEQHLKNIQKSLSIYLAVGALSSVGVNLLMQKMIPSFSKLTAGRLILDLGLASVCVGAGLYLSLNQVQPQVEILKKKYLLENNLSFSKYLKNQSAENDISIEKLVKRFLNQQEYSVWDITQGIDFKRLE